MSAEIRYGVRHASMASCSSSASRSLSPAREVYGQAMWTAVPEMAHFPPKPIVGQRCAYLAPDPADRQHHVTCSPRWAASPLRSSLSFRYAAARPHALAVAEFVGWPRSWHRHRAAAPSRCRARYRRIRSAAVIGSAPRRGRPPLLTPTGFVTGGRGSIGFVIATGLGFVTALDFASNCASRICRSCAFAADPDFVFALLQ